jgi:hypothetical protein
VPDFPNASRSPSAIIHIQNNKIPNQVPNDFLCTISVGFSNMPGRMVMTTISKQNRLAATSVLATAKRERSLSKQHT